MSSSSPNQGQNANVDFEHEARDLSASLAVDKVMHRIYHVRGVLFPELRRAEISESGMQPAGIVDLIDEAGNIGADVRIAPVS